MPLSHLLSLPLSIALLSLRSLYCLSLESATYEAGPKLRVGTGRVFEKRVGLGHTKALAGWVGSDPLPKRRVGLTRQVDPCGSTRRVKLTGQRFISALQNKKLSFSIILLFLKYFSFIIILFTIQEKKCMV